MLVPLLFNFLKFQMDISFRVNVSCCEKSNNLVTCPMWITALKIIK